jgi:hypothetical protein
VPSHLLGGRVEEFLEEFIAIKVLIKTEAGKIWHGCAKAYRRISTADASEKRRVFSEQFETWRNQLIKLQESLIAFHLLPLVSKYQISSSEQKWLLAACNEAWVPVADGYLDWLTVVIRGHRHGVGTEAIPEWAWQLAGAQQDMVPSGLNPQKKASAHFRWLAVTLRDELEDLRNGAVAKAFVSGKGQEAFAITRRERPGRPKPPCFESAAEQLRQKPALTLLEFCQLMDRKADQYQNTSKYLPPKTWGVRCFKEQYDKRSNTVSRFLFSVRSMNRSEGY